MNFVTISSTNDENTFLASEMKKDSFAVIVNCPRAAGHIIGKVLYQSIGKTSDGSSYGTGLYIIGNKTWVDDPQNYTVRKLHKNEKIIITER